MDQEPVPASVWTFCSSSCCSFLSSSSRPLLVSSLSLSWLMVSSFCSFSSCSLQISSSSNTEENQLQRSAETPPGLHFLLPPTSLVGWFSAVLLVVMLPFPPVLLLGAPLTALKNHTLLWDVSVRGTSWTSGEHWGERLRLWQRSPRIPVAQQWIGLSAGRWRWALTPSVAPAGDIRAHQNISTIKSTKSIKTIRNFKKLKSIKTT